LAAISSARGVACAPAAGLLWEGRKPYRVDTRRIDRELAGLWAGRPRRSRGLGGAGGPDARRLAARRPRGRSGDGGMSDLREILTAEQFAARWQVKPSHV